MSLRGTGGSYPAADQLQSTGFRVVQHAPLRFMVMDRRLARNPKGAGPHALEVATFAVAINFKSPLYGFHQLADRHALLGESRPPIHRASSISLAPAATGQQPEPDFHQPM